MMNSLRKGCLRLPPHAVTRRHHLLQRRWSADGAAPLRCQGRQILDVRHGTARRIGNNLYGAPGCLVMHDSIVPCLPWLPWKPSQRCPAPFEMDLNERSAFLPSTWLLRRRRPLRSRCAPDPSAGQRSGAEFHIS